MSRMSQVIFCFMSTESSSVLIKNLMSVYEKFSLWYFHPCFQGRISSYLSIYILWSIMTTIWMSTYTNNLIDNLSNENEKRQHQTPPYNGPDVIFNSVTWIDRCSSFFSSSSFFWKTNEKNYILLEYLRVGSLPVVGLYITVCHRISIRWVPSN